MTPTPVSLRVSGIFWNYAAELREPTSPSGLRRRDNGRIVTSTVSDRFLREFDATPRFPGVYWLPPGGPTGIMVVDQFPITPDTFWLRFLGRGGVGINAIKEVFVMPQGDILRNDGLQLLSSFFND